MLTIKELIYLVNCYDIENVLYRCAVDMFYDKFPNTAVSREKVKLVNKSDLNGSVVTVKKHKNKYNKDDTALLLALGAVIETAKLSLRKRS